MKVFVSNFISNNLFLLFSIFMNYNVVTYKIILCNWNIKLNDWFICKVSNRSNFYLQIPLVGIHGLSDILFFFFGRPTYEVFYKITLICLSVRQFGIFLRNCSLSFLIFEYLLQDLCLQCFWDFYEKFQDSYFSEHRKRIFMLCIFLAELKAVLLGNFHLLSSSWNGKTQNKDFFCEIKLWYHFSSKFTRSSTDRSMQFLSQKL